jgi:hypothetical protein
VSSVQLYDRNGELRFDGTEIGGAQPFTVATKTLTDAQIKALPTAPPIEIVPSPGPGNVIVGLQAIIHLKDWVADYTNINADAVLQFGLGGFGLAALGGILSEGSGGFVSILLAGGGPDGTWAFFPPAARGITIASLGTIPQAVGDSGWYDSDLDDKSVTLFADNKGDSDFEDGDPGQSFVVTYAYMVLPI